MRQDEGRFFLKKMGKERRQGGANVIGLIASVCLRLMGLGGRRHDKGLKGARVVAMVTRYILFKVEGRSWMQMG